MKTHTYEIQKGDGVLPRFIGKKVEVQQATSIKEALEAGHAENEQAILAAFNRDRNIKVNRIVRTALEKVADGETDAQALARAVAAGNKAKIGGPQERKTPAGAKPKTVVKSVGAAAGNRMFERMLVEPAYRDAALAQGFAVKEEFEAWKAAKQAAAQPAAAQAAAPVAPAPAQPVPKATPAPAKAGRSASGK